MPMASRIPSFASHPEFVRQDVQNLAVFGKRNVAAGIHGAAHVIALNVARPVAKSDSGAAVDAAHVAAGNTPISASSTGTFATLSASSTARRIELTAASRLTIRPLRSPLDSSLAARRQKLQEFAFDFGNENGSLCAADVQPHQIFVFLRQAAASCDESILFLLAAVPALVSGFTTTCRMYCKSMDCTRPVFACHCEKLSTSILYLPVNTRSHRRLNRSRPANPWGPQGPGHHHPRRSLGFERSSSLTLSDDPARTKSIPFTNSW